MRSAEVANVFSLRVVVGTLVVGTAEVEKRGGRGTEPVGLKDAPGTAVTTQGGGEPRASGYAVRECGAWLEHADGRRDEDGED